MLLRILGYRRMKKFPQIIYVVVLLSFAPLIHAASVILEEEVDEFNDYVSYYLIFTEDTKPSSLLFQCKPWSIFTPHSFSIMPEAMWTNDYSLNVTFRFDKDDQFWKRMTVGQNQIVYSDDKSFINRILIGLKQSENFVLKVQNQETQRFSGLTDADKKKIDRFLEISSNHRACS